jgi:putative transposon-encoded protein
MVSDDERRDRGEKTDCSAKVKFEIYGQELIEKTVRSSGNSGRVYLPPEWIGTKVKVIKC